MTPFDKPNELRLPTVVQRVQSLGLRWFIHRHKANQDTLPDLGYTEFCAGRLSLRIMAFVM